MDPPRITELKQKYGAAIIENGLRHRPDTFIGEVDWRDKIDPHYTRLWLEFTYGGLFTRKRLDERTRFLVSLTQFLCLAEYEEFEHEVHSALKAGACGGNSAIARPTASRAVAVSPSARFDNPRFSHDAPSPGFS